MPRTIRFHLDEHVDPAIADGLRQQGVDVTTTPEAGLRGASDEQQLEFALSEGRVIVTHDADYLRLHQAGTEHAGIAYGQSARRSIGELIDGLLLIWGLLEPDEMAGRVEFL